MVTDAFHFNQISTDAAVWEQNADWRALLTALHYRHRYKWFRKEGDYSSVGECLGKLFYLTQEKCDGTEFLSEEMQCGWFGIDNCSKLRFNIPKCKKIEKVDFKSSSYDPDYLEVYQDGEWKTFLEAFWNEEFKLVKLGNDGIPWNVDNFGAFWWYIRKDDDWDKNLTY